MPDTWSRRETRRIAGVLAGVAIAVAGIGCGGSAGPADRAPAADPVDRVPELIETNPRDIFNVHFYTTGGQFLVEKLEIEFNRRRGIHEFYGFHRDSYTDLARIPFRDLSRLDFLGPMPPQIFDQAIIGRENENLRQDQAFQVRLTFRDGRQEEFFALIPKFRGIKDLELWEFSMNNRNNVIDYLEFTR